MRKAANGMGNIRQRPDGRWEARVTRDGKRVSVYGATQSEVAGKLTDKVTAERAGIPEVVASARYTVGACLTDWLAYLRQENQLKASTYQNYAAIVRTQLMPRFGQIRLSKFSFRDLEAAYAELRQEGKTRITIQGIHSVMHNAMQWAERNDKVMKDPTALVDSKSFGRKQKRHRGLTVPEVKAVLKVLREDEWWDGFFTTALFGGLRFGELAALRWKDLELEEREDGRGLLHVEHGLHRVSKATAKNLGLTETTIIGTPKTETSVRQVMLPTLAVEALLRHRGRQKERYIAAMKALGRSWSSKELVFQSQRFSPVNQSEANKAWHRIQSEAGMPFHEHVRMHDTRRTAITMGVGAGDLRAVMAFAGHAKAEQSMAYTDPGRQEAIARHMEQLMAEEIEEKAN